MSTQRVLWRRSLSGMVAIAMVLTTVPITGVSAVAQPATSALGAPAFEKLTPSGPIPSFGPGTARTDVVNVRWRKGVTSARIQVAARRFGFTASKTSKLGWAQVTPTGSTAPGALARSLRQARLVTDAEAPLRMKALDVAPNDPLFPSQWALDNTGQAGGTPGADIGATEAWSETTGSRDVIVAIVDEGVNWAHPDLKNNVWLNTAEIPNNEEDDDGNGYADDVRGWDFYNGDGTVYDLSDGDRHGTHVAGIIGAESDNGLGMAGVNKHVRLMPLKFIGGDGYGEDYDAADAIVYAVDNGATVINCSWGGGDSELIKDAVDYAASKGVILSVSAGNDYSNNDDPEWASYPASYDTTNVISVAASDRNDELAEWSNFGEDSVDLAAPGVDVTSTMPAEQVGFYTDEYLYKTVFLPVQAEILEPASARDALIAGAVRQLGEASDTPILVVDDSAAKVTSETPGVRLKVYTDALADAGYPDVTTWVVDDKGSPTAAAMTGKIVVWFTGKDTVGWYDEQCLNTEEQSAITEYLDAGGRVVLISGKAATDLQYFGDYYYEEDGPDEGLDLISDYFGAEWQGYEHWGRDFEGRSTSALAGLRLTIPEAYADPESEGNLWPTASDAVTRAEGAERSTAIMYTGQYAPLSGTSMAAPHVTGAIALLKAKYPMSSPDELVARVLNTVDRKPAFTGKTATGGRLNLAAAMSSYPGRVSITAPRKGDRLHTGDESTLRWTPAVAGSPDATFTAQIGIPYGAFANGFEDGTLGTFEEPEYSGSPWSASTETTAVRTGSYGAMSGPLPPAVPAPEMGEGWYRMGASSMAATITVPEGGGDFSFYWRMPESDGWDTSAAFFTDETGGWLENWELDDPNAWTKETYHLTAGDHYVVFEALNSSDETSNVSLYIDDITLTAHHFTDLGAAAASSTSLEFTVPSEATDDAWFRVQSHLDGVDSAWATVKGVRLVSDAVAPMAPSALTLSPDLDGGVGITWGNPPDPDFDHTLVLASTDHMPTSRDDTEATVAYEGTGTVAAFGPIVDGTTVYVSAWAEDTSGNWSSAVTSQVVGIDDTAPTAPWALRVIEPVPGLPVVLWSGDPSGTSKATVLRSYMSTPIVGDLDAMSVRAEPGAAVDWDIDPDAPQAFYTVYLTDPSGNTSLPRSTRATFHPGGITGTIAVESDEIDPLTESAIVETSTVWVNAHVTHATEMRVSVNGEGDPDADWVPFQSRFQVELLPLHGAQDISVEFRGSADQMPTQLWASVLVILRAPLAPRYLASESWNTGVKLSWDVPADPTLASYRVERATSSGGPWTPVARPSTQDVEDASLFVAGLAPSRTYYFRTVGVDILGRQGAPSVVVTGTAGLGTRRFSGADRVGTAISASAAVFSPATDDPAENDAVVIAPGTDYIQALAANSLAGRYGASVLLAGPSLSAGTINEIKRLGVHRAMVVGTTAAVSPSVDTALKGMGIRVERITGADSYAVAAKVARRMSGSAFGSRNALVVNGSSRSDMCSLMPIAYASGRPVFVVKPTSIPTPVKALLAITPLDSVTIVGGTKAVSSAVYRSFSKNTPTQRVWGRTAAETAVALAEWGASNGLVSWENVSVANPTMWAQSLNIGAASSGGIVLLTSGTSLNSATASALMSNAESIDTVSIFGGLGTISSTVQSRIRRVMSIATTGPIMDSEFIPEPDPDDSEM